MTDLHRQYLDDLHVQMEALCHLVHLRGETLSPAECRAQLQAMCAILRDTRQAYDDEREARRVQRWQRLEEAIAHYEADTVRDDPTSTSSLCVPCLVGTVGLSVLLNGIVWYLFFS